MKRIITALLFFGFLIPNQIIYAQENTKQANLIYELNDYIIKDDKVWELKEGKYGEVKIQSSEDWFSSEAYVFEKPIIPLEGVVNFSFNYHNYQDTVSTSLGLGINAYQGEEKFELYKFNDSVGRPSSGNINKSFIVGEDMQVPIEQMSCFAGGGKGHGSQSSSAHLTKWLEPLDNYHPILIHYPNEDIKAFYNSDFNTSLDELSREAYNFLGWKNKGSDEIIREIKAGRNDINELFPVFEPIRYHIEYELDGAVIFDDIPNTYTIEDEIVLASPNKNGYVFKCWIDQDGNELNIIDKGSHRDLRLKAIFEECEYEIGYQLNGGYNNKLNLLSYTISDEEIILYPAFKDGHLFKGWYVDDEKIESIKPSETLSDLLIEAIFVKKDQERFVVVNTLSTKK